RRTAEKRGERWLEYPAVEQHVDAHDRRVLEPRILVAEEPRALDRRNGEHESVGFDPLSVSEHRSLGLELGDPGPRPYDRTRRFERACGRVAVHRAERARRQYEVAGPTGPEERPLNREDGRRRARLLASEGPRRPHEDVPEAV